MASRVETLIRSTLVKGINALSDYNRKRMPPPQGAHPYLTGLHEPMTQELTLDALQVEGEIPHAVSGRYVRNGPNPVGPVDPASYHWFTGHGMVHGLRIEQGKVLWYRNRWVRGEDACRALGETIPDGPRRAGSDAPNTNVVSLGGRTFAIVEAGGIPAELDDELRTIAHNDFDGTLAGSYTAHPHFDPVTGESHAITYRGEEQRKIWHVVLDRNAHVIREEAVPVADGPSIHDCAITRNHVLIFDLPVTFSMKSLIQGYRFPYSWNEAHPARVGLLPREGTASEIIWVPVEPCYIFHPANAFETEDGKIVVDLVVHDSMFARSKRGPDSRRSQLERWTIDPLAKHAERRVLHSAPQEFPRYDERRTTLPYRYIYTVALADDAQPEMAVSDTRIYRHDLESGESIARDFGPDRHPGEFIFIPRAPQSAEDDGWLMGLVVDMAQHHSELHILNADDFTGAPQAVIHLPHRIPPGFHGNWLPDA